MTIKAIISIAADPKSTETMMSSSEESAEIKSMLGLLNGSFHQVGASFMTRCPCYVGRCTIHYPYYECTFKLWSVHCWKLLHLKFFRLNETGNYVKFINGVVIWKTKEHQKHKTVFCNFFKKHGHLLWQNFLWFYKLYKKKETNKQQKHIC